MDKTSDSADRFPRLYAIIDRGTLDARGIGVEAFALALREAGVRLVQYRDKINGPQEVLRAAAAITAVFASIDAKLVMNDRADLAALAGWGVHVGQNDLLPADARRVVGQALVGVSTHNGTQVLEADAGAADYVAIGPVFATGSKLDAEPSVGLAGVRRARACTKKPLIAIGGITAETCRSVLEAGADCVAVIGALLPDEGMTVQQRAEKMMRVLR